MASWAPFGGVRPLFHLLLRSRYELFIGLVWKIGQDRGYKKEQPEPRRPDVGRADLRQLQ